MTTEQILWEIVGWSGSILVILAYGLNSYQKLKSDSLGFNFFNLVGGVLLIFYSFYKQADANAFINIVWVLIALIAIIRFVQNRSLKAEKS
jgi:hypothetical protein